MIQKLFRILYYSALHTEREVNAASAFRGRELKTGKFSLTIGYNKTNLLLSLYRKNNTDGKLWGSQRIEFFMDQQSLVAMSNRTSLVNNKW